MPNVQSVLLLLVVFLLHACAEPVSGRLDSTGEPEPQADGTLGVALFDTPLWGSVVLDYEWRDGRMVHGGDVVLDADLYVHEVSGDEPELSVPSGLVRRASITPWPKVNGEVRIPYKWDSNMPETKKNKVRKAMDDLEAELPFLKFVQNQNATGRWIRVVSKNQAYCYVRMRSSGETVLEAGNPCTWHTYVHEIGHTLSLRHEQLRKDRPAHVTFYKSRTSSPSQFCWDDGTHCIGKDYLGTTYDTSSIMQYPSCMLANQNNCGPNTPAKWVLERTSGNQYIPWWEKRSFGQVLSASDKCGIKTMFGMACNTPTPPPTCTPETCETLGNTCGSGYADGCGTTLTCGVCAGTEVCNAGTCVAVSPFPIASWSTGTIQNDATGATLCAEGDGDGSVDGALVSIATCNSTAVRQNWTLTRSGQLQNYETRQCAAATEVSDGAGVVQQACANDPGQQWKLGNMELVNGESGKCVDAANAVAGAGLVYAACNDGSSQRFTYDPQSRQLRIDGWCVTGADTADTAVTLQTCEGSDAQVWTAARGGFINRANVDLCLAVDGGADSADGAAIVVSDCSDAVGQMWALRGAIEFSDDQFCLRAAGEGEQLSIANCDAAAADQRMTFWSNFGCTPTTCEDLGANCGTIPDDCGESADCGACGSNQECSDTNVCVDPCEDPGAEGCDPAEACVPATCEDSDEACGVLDDDCGATIDCGPCEGPDPDDVDPDDGINPVDEGSDDPSDGAAETTSGCNCSTTRTPDGVPLLVLLTTIFAVITRRR